MYFMCFFCLVFAMTLCVSVYMCPVVTCLERADLLDDEFLQHKLLKLAGIFNTHTLQLHNQNAENVTEKAFKNNLFDRYCVW